MAFSQYYIDEIKEYLLDPANRADKRLIGLVDGAFDSSTVFKYGCYSPESDNENEHSPFFKAFVESSIAVTALEYIIRFNPSKSPVHVSYNANFVNNPIILGDYSTVIIDAKNLLIITIEGEKIESQYKFCDVNIYNLNHNLDDNKIINTY